MKRSRFVVLLVVGVFVLAACGGGDDDGGAGTTGAAGGDGGGVAGRGRGLRRQSGARQQPKCHRGQRDDCSVAQRGHRCASFRQGIGVWLHFVR